MKTIKTLIFSVLILMEATIAHAQGGGKYASVNGIKMYYEIHGSGSPLVLLHGGGSNMYTTFGVIMPILAKNHQVIAIDLQAHGRTGDRDAPVSFQQDAADVAELLKQLGIAKANIMGFSNGGQTCIELGIKHAERINKLVIASAFYKRDAVPAGFWKGFENPKYSDMPQVYKDEYLKTGTQAGLTNMFNKDASRMLHFKDWTDEDLKSIKAPSLVIIGDHDLPSPDHAAQMSRLLPHGRLAILPGTHGSYIGEAMTRDTGSKVPGLVAAMIDEFLAAPVEEAK